MPLTIRQRGRYWFARGTVPARQSSGEIVNVRIERSLKTVSRNDALKRAADIERYYWNLAHGKIEKPGPTFAQAAKTYIRTRGKSDGFITTLIAHFGMIPLSEIDQEKATEAAAKLYPGWKQSSINRAVFTPLMAIGARGLTRPKSEQSEIIIPPDDWFDKVFAVAPRNLSAMIVFLTATGRRVGEAIGLTRKRIDDQGYAHIGRTKTGKPVLVKVPELCWELLEGSRPHERLFGYYTLAGAYSSLTYACNKAGVHRYKFHAIGRHSFATRALRAGKSIKWVQIAGGWESPKVPMQRYLHLEQSEVAREADGMGAEWGKGRTGRPKKPGKRPKNDG